MTATCIEMLKVKDITRERTEDVKQNFEGVSGNNL
jgi:hypothetical protein